MEDPCYAQYGSFFKYEREMWKAFEPLTDAGVVTNVTFEDLKLRPAPTMKKIGQHLGMGWDDDFYQRVRPG